MKTLYHASRIPRIRVLKPSPHPAVDNQSVVFATTDPLFALAMTYGSGDVLAVSYTLNSTTGIKELYIDELSPGALALFEKPASVYEVTHEGFVQDSHLHAAEWIAFTDVAVIKETRIVNVLAHLREQGVHLIPYPEVPASMRARGRSPGKPSQRHKPGRFGKLKK